MPATARKIFFPALIFAMLLAGYGSSGPAASSALAASSAPAAQPAPASAAPGLKALEGLWRADMEATAKGFQPFPDELKRSLADLTVQISAANAKMLLKWADGKTQTRSLKLLSQKDSRYNLKVNNENELIIDASQPDILVFIEEQNSIVFKKVPEEETEE